MHEAELQAPRLPDGGRDHQPDGALTSGPVARVLLAFAMPTIAASMLQTLNLSINAMWVGHLLGHEALAATANVNLILGLVHMVTLGFGMAVTILIARAMGADDIGAMRRHLGAGVGLFSLAGLAIAVAGTVAAPWLLAPMQMPANVYPLALDYVGLCFAGLPMGLLFFFLVLALRGTGDAKTPLLFVVLSTVLDIALNPVLILGLGPLPRMGVAGSALASLLASSASLVLLVGYVYLRDLPIRLRGHELRHLLPPLPLFWTILRQGIPMGLQMIVSSVAALTMMILVNGEGTATVAAYAAVMQLWGYVSMPANGLGSAASTMAAQNIGAGRWDRVDRIAVASAALGFAITLALVVFLIALDRQVLALFLDVDGESLPIAQHINHRATLGFVLYGALLPLVVIPRANGANIAPLIIMTIMFIPVRLGFAALLRPYWGADALWWSFPISFFVAGVLIVSYYRFGGWRQLRTLTDSR